MRAGDSDWLYDLLTFTNGSRWRYRGRTPHPGDLQADLWRGVLAQFVVEDSAGHPVGLVGGYNANTTAGHCHVFALGADDRGPLVMEATGLLIGWLFEQFEFDKVWIECAEFNLLQFESLTGIAEVEARLTNFDYWQGRYWDLLILSISNSAWVTSVRPLLATSSTPGTPEPTPRPDFERALEPILDHHLPMDSLSAAVLLSELEDLVGRPLEPNVLEGLDEVPVSDGVTILSDRLATLADLAGERQQPFSSSGPPCGYGHEPSGVALR